MTDEYFDVIDSNGKENRFVGATWVSMKPDQSVIEVRNKEGKTLQVFFRASSVKYPDKE
jgi:acyl-homoserine lactone acylase PvdQ